MGTDLGTATTIDHPIVSCDDHMDLNVLPPDLFVSRVPADVRDRVPQVRETDTGPFWFLGDRSLAPSGKRPQGYRVREERGLRPADPALRVEDMDRDGVFTHVVYGPLGGLPAADREAQIACIRAFNDWGAEINAPYPDRLQVLAHLPGHAPGPAIAEFERVAALGYRGVLIDPFIGEPRVYAPEWARFWDVANETAMPVSVHIGGGMHSVTFQGGVWQAPATASAIAMQLDEVLACALFSGILVNRPNAKIVFGESGLGWVPYLLERMDQQHERFRDSIGTDALPMRPSELFHRQCFMTYEEDDVGLELIERIGVRNVMWASDYPHGDSTWPYSHEAILSSPLGRLSAADRRRVVCDNAAELYKITLP